MQVLRTPEDRFADLPGFGYPPRYAEAGGLRLAYVEAGPPGGEPVLLLDGEARLPRRGGAAPGGRAVAAAPRRAELVVPVPHGHAGPGRRRAARHRGRPG